MEALGTALGGGALKLEATHLRQIPAPVFSHVAKAQLDTAGRELTRATPVVQAHIDGIIVRSIMGETFSSLRSGELSKALAYRAYKMSRVRQRTAS